LKPLVLTLVVFVFLLSFINLFSFNVVYASDDKELPKDTTITRGWDKTPSKMETAHEILE